MARGRQVSSAKVKIGKVDSKSFKWHGKRHMGKGWKRLENQTASSNIFQRLLFMFSTPLKFAAPSAAFQVQVGEVRRFQNCKASGLGFSSGFQQVDMVNIGELWSCEASSMYFQKGNCASWASTCLHIGHQNGICTIHSIIDQPLWTWFLVDLRRSFDIFWQSSSIAPMFCSSKAKA